jgi:hypothetical protein
LKKLGSLLILAALVVAACGGAVQGELIERAAEAGGAGDVEIDITDDTVSIRVETEEGSFAIGSGLDVPDGLTFPLPNGGEVTQAGTDASYVFAAVQYPKDRYDEIVALYKDWTSADDREWNLIESSTEMSGETIRGAQWISGASAITVNDCVTLSGQFDSVCVVLNQSG